MNNDVTDGAIYFKLFLSCQIFRKKLLETNLKKKPVNFIERKDKQTNRQYSVFTWRHGGHIGVPKQ